MATTPKRGITSTASIAQHPIHPMLIVFPIAALVGALLTDLAYWRTDDPFWADASAWLVGTGLVTGVVAAVFGLIDFVTIRRAREHAAGWIHAGGNVSAMVLALISLVLRLDDAADAVLPWGLVLSALVVGILLVTGWFGGELAYRHKIGVIEDNG